MRHEPTGRSESVSSSGNEPASQAERSLRARLAAYALHAQRDSRETTANGRAAFLARFDCEVDPEGRLEPDERGAGPSRPAVPTSLASLWPPLRLARPSAPHKPGGRRMGPRHDRGGLLA
jgi:hypothetical protein